VIIGLIAGGSLPAHAGGLTLADLVGGKTITCGNLKFSMFTYDPSNVPDMPQAKDIMVKCVSGPNGVGLEFDGVWKHTPDDGRIAMARLSYQVQVLAGAPLQAAYLMSQFSANAGQEKEGSVQVTESVFPVPCPS
jgi:hypothetical protein